MATDFEMVGAVAAYVVVGAAILAASQSVTIGHNVVSLSERKNPKWPTRVMPKSAA